MEKHTPRAHHVALPWHVSSAEVRLFVRCQAFPVHRADLLTRPIQQAVSLSATVDPRVLTVINVVSSAPMSQCECMVAVCLLVDAV